MSLYSVFINSGLYFRQIMERVDKKQRPSKTMPWPLPHSVTTLCLGFIGYTSAPCASVCRIFRIAADNVIFGTETVNVRDPSIIPDKIASKIINMNLLSHAFLSEFRFANLRGLRIDFGDLENVNQETSRCFNQCNECSESDYCDCHSDWFYCLDLPHTPHLTAITVVSWNGTIDPYLGILDYKCEMFPRFSLFQSRMPALEFLTIDANIFTNSMMTLELRQTPALKELYISPDSNIRIRTDDINKVLDRVNAPVDFCAVYSTVVLPDVTHFVAHTHVNHDQDDNYYGIRALFSNAYRMQHLDMRGVKMDVVDPHWDCDEEEEEMKAIIWNNIQNIETIRFNSAVNDVGWWAKGERTASRLRRKGKNFQWRRYDVPKPHTID